MLLIRKSVLVLVVSFLAAPAFAGSDKNPWTQCGIGAMIFSNTTWAAAISNVIWDLGTTASSSTSSSDHYCEGKSASTAKFIYETYANLEEETAAGSGLHLVTMLTTLGCDAEAHPAITSAVRSDFATSLGDANYASLSQLDRAKAYYNNVMNKVTGSFADQCNVI